MADKPSRDGLAELVKLYGAHHAAGLELVSICVDGAGGPEKFAAFVREQGLTWPQVLDGEKSAGPLAQQFALKRVPAVFLLGRDGRIVLQLSQASRLEKYVTTRLARPPAL